MASKKWSPQGEANERFNHRKPPPCFFIVGSGRSGTTLLQSLLSHHSRIAIPPETHFFSKGLRAGRSALQGSRILDVDSLLDRLRTLEYLKPLLPRRPLQGLTPQTGDGGQATRARPFVTTRSSQSLDVGTLFDHLMRHYAKREGKDLWGEKTPHHLWYWRRIHRLFPEARFLLMIRDGRDVSVSLSETPWASSNLWINAFRWRHEFAIGRRLCAQLGPSQVLVVRYEDLVSNAKTTLHEVSSFLGVPFEDAMVDSTAENRHLIHRHERGWKQRNLKGITSSRVGRHAKALSRKTSTRLTTLLRRELIEAGYIKDDKALSSRVLDRLNRAFLSLYSGTLFFGSYGLRSARRKMGRKKGPDTKAQV